jgi:hypothetical protein
MPKVCHFQICAWQCQRFRIFLFTVSVITARRSARECINDYPVSSSPCQPRAASPSPFASQSRRSLRACPCAPVDALPRERRECSCAAVVGVRGEDVSVGGGGGGTGGGGGGGGDGGTKMGLRWSIDALPRERREYSCGGRIQTGAQQHKLGPSRNRERALHP